MGLFSKKPSATLPSGTIREQVTFMGRVQHVGFRYEMLMLARRYGVTGCVENRYDGTVYAELQGTEAHVAAVLTDIDAIPRIVIERMDRRRVPPVPGETGFTTD